MYLSSNADGVLVSPDKGKSWKPLNNGLEELITSRFVVFKEHLYLQGALIEHNVRMGGNLYRLSSDGLRWEKVPEVGQVTGLATDGTTLFVGTWNPDPKLWVSLDGNVFQDKLSQGLPPDWLGEIAVVNSKIYVGAGGNGIYVSYDGGDTFMELNTGLISIATREVHVNPQNENEIYVGTWDRLGFYWSKNGGRQYKHLANDAFVLTLQPNPGDFSRLYIGGDNFFSGKIGDEQFVQKNKPGSAGTFIKSIGIDPQNFNHVLAGVGSEVAETPPGEGVWESKDGGESWMRAQGIGNFAVYSILFDFTDPRIVYASALGEGVFKSIDGGSHFQKIGGEELMYTYRLAMSSSDPQVLVASSNLFFAGLSDSEVISGKYGGIFQTRDGGKTWKDMTAIVRTYEGGEREEDFLGWLWNFGHMPNYEMILIDPKNPDHLVVGHHGENVVETIDGGMSWKKAGAEEMVPIGIHNYAYCLGSSSDFKKFYACTCGRGLFRGVINKNGFISQSLTGNVVYVDKLDEHPWPHNADEARKLIFSGEYNHKH